MRQLLLLLLVATAQAIPTTAQSREKGLDAWVDRDLIPYVKQQLVKHPRFKGETVMFVVLNDNLPASSSNALALSLRDRVLEASVRTNGVSIGWQQGHGTAALESTATDCLHDRVHYYVGIELTQELDSRYSVKLRALDLEDKTWVSGFGKQWRGNLTTIQRQAMRQQRVDETFLGARDVPFTLAQTDLLATHLAHQLSCTLQQQLEGDYVVNAEHHGEENDGNSNELSGTVELIGNNLARRQALVLTSDTSQANSILAGKAHHIDGMLYQYWLTVTPQSHADQLAALSASAYIVLPDAPRTTDVSASVAPSVNVSQTPTSEHIGPSSISIPNAGSSALLESLQITAPRSAKECRQPCSMLRSEARSDSIVFVLQHQANHGLVRLSGGVCRQRTAATVVRGGDILSFPIAKSSQYQRENSETFEWVLHPDADTYYAVAVTNADVARQLANHIDALPLRCANAFRPGLSGEPLRNWLSEFAMQSAKSAKHLDWRAIQVRDIT